MMTLPPRPTLFDSLSQGLLLGPSIAPVLAGILTQYATGPDGGWRSVQWLLAGLGAVALGVSMLLPETIHVKGIDRVISARREAQIKAGQPARDSKFIWVWVNPLRSVKLLKYPNVLAIVSCHILQAGRR
jgi:MFS family permease